MSTAQIALTTHSGLDVAIDHREIIVIESIDDRVIKARVTIKCGVTFEVREDMRKIQNAILRAQEFEKQEQLTQKERDERPA